MKRWIIGLLVGMELTCRAGYVEEVTADGPEAYYRFEESTGATQLLDSSGNGYHGTVVSNVELGDAGLVGASGNFNDEGRIQLDFYLDPAAGDFSVEALIRFDEGVVNRSILQQQAGDGIGRTVFYRTSGGALRSYLGGQGTTSDLKVSLEEWHHVVMTVEENGTNDLIRFYIDGEFAGSGTTSVESANGSWILANGSLVGVLDEVAVYSQVLSADRILAHYEACPSVHYVSLTGSSVSPYSTWETAAISIQDAVDAAAAGDTVLVADGSYDLGSQIMVDQALTIASVHGQELTTVEGGNSRCFYLNNCDTVIHGFTIMYGREEGGNGGGVYCGGTKPRIQNCLITRNSVQGVAHEVMGSLVGGVGGGGFGGTWYNCVISNNTVYVSENNLAGDAGGVSQGVLVDCTIVDNEAAFDSGEASASKYQSQGGGVLSCTLSNCIISGNSAYMGGGSYNCTLTNCELNANSANVGGGSYNSTLINCTLSGNSAAIGGGSCGGTLTDCLVSGNSAESGGGSSGSTLTHCTLSGNSAVNGGGSRGSVLTGCVLHDNSAIRSGSAGGIGGGSYDDTLTHCTLVENSAYTGGGSSGSTVKNCILWDNTADSSADNLSGGTVTYSCWPEGSSGTGNINSDPCFVYNTFRLVNGSACIDAGVSVSGLTQDMDGNSIPLDGDFDGVSVPDMGVCEYDPDSSDADGDGRSDSFEHATGLNLFFNESSAIDAVLAHPAAFGLYSDSSIADLSLDGLVLQVANGQVRLNLQLEQCTNLVDGVWTNAGDAVQWQVEAPGDKVFYRVRSGE